MPSSQTYFSFTTNHRNTIDITEEEVNMLGVYNRQLTCEFLPFDF